MSCFPPHSKTLPTLVSACTVAVPAKLPENQAPAPHPRLQASVRIFLDIPKLVPLRSRTPSFGRQDVFLTEVLFAS